MRFATFALAALAFVASAFAEEVEIEDDVYVLGDKNFDNFVKENKFVLTEFYAPWCGHCKALAPEYSKAAAQLKEAGVDVKLAKVDSTIHTEISGKHEIRGYPTLKFFRDGNPTEYNGGRQAAEIVNWLSKKTGPPAAVVEDVEKLTALKEKSDVFVLGVFDDAESAAAKGFLDAAANFDETAFGITTNADVRKAAEVKEAGDFIVLFKSFDEKRADFDGKFEKEAVIDFIKGNYLPYVMEFNQQNQPKIFGGDIKSHSLLFGTKDQHKEVAECYAEAAKKFRGKIMYITVDTAAPEAANVLQFFKIESAGPLSLRVINLEGDLMKYSPEGEITCATFTDFVQSYVDGKVEPFLSSEEIPEDWDAEPVKVLVGKNFAEVALNKTATVFVEFYAPWCGHCKALIPTWDKLAKHYEKTPGVVIAKMDSTANEVKEVRVSGFPTLKLYKNGESIDYSGDRSFEDLVKFMDKHLGGKPAAEEDEEDEEEETPKHEEL